MQAYWLVVRVLLTPLEARKEKALTGLTFFKKKFDLR